MSHHEKQRIGNYVMLNEIGKGSFATVYKGYRHKTHEPIAIKAVSRQKLTAKLLENLEIEIKILKAISHHNIVALEDCIKNDTHIYLIMDFCSGSDLSFYIKNRGRLSTLEFFPRGTVMNPPPPASKAIFWPHPKEGGLDEKVTRCFLGQLAQALRFLRTQNLIHRDIKPQNLLLQPATAEELEAGHPLGIPVLKVADFGFARILPAAAMAETLCGSPLYMAPEILRYEKYDAKADLWSVGAVLFEMAVGRPPFRANNHVELLRKIEKGEDRIKFLDEATPAPDQPPSAAVPVAGDIKALIRKLLKRQPVQRMGFEDFFASGVWEGYMIEDRSATIEAVKTPAAQVYMPAADAPRRSSVTSIAGRPRAPQPISTQEALNPQPAPKHSTSPSIAQRPVLQPSPTQPSAPVFNKPLQPRKLSEPKYFVSSGEAPVAAPTPIAAPARPLMPPKYATSLDDASPVQSTTPASVGAAQQAPRIMGRILGEGSPLAATPPMTMHKDGSITGKAGEVISSEDSMLGREYVVVEKRTVEINSLADEVDAASKRPLARRPSSRNSVLSRPISALKSVNSSSPPGGGHAPLSYSPPFSLSSTPPFALPNLYTRNSVPHGISTLPRPNSTPTTYHQAAQDAAARFGSSPVPSGGVLTRALHSTALRLLGGHANSAANALVKATRGTSRSASVDPAEERLLLELEDLAQKAFVLSEFADAQLLISTGQPPAVDVTGASPLSPHIVRRRRSSSVSASSTPLTLSEQEVAAAEAMVLYVKSMSFLQAGMESAKRYWNAKSASRDQFDTTFELNDTVQWFRGRFNEAFDRADMAKARCPEDLPESAMFIDKLVYDQAIEVSRSAAICELTAKSGADAGYETALWLLLSLLDEKMHDGHPVADADRHLIDKLISSIRVRLDALRKKIADAAASSAVPSK